MIQSPYTFPLASPSIDMGTMLLNELHTSIDLTSFPTSVLVLGSQVEHCI